MLAKMIPHDWLTPAQAGRKLGVTPNRVRQLIEEGALGCQRTPLGRLIDPKSLEELIAERASAAAFSRGNAEEAKKESRQVREHLSGKD